jgi:hypothetical protein
MVRVDLNILPIILLCILVDFLNTHFGWIFELNTLCDDRLDI